MTTSSISVSVDVYDVHKVGILRTQHVFNEFDEHGLVLGVARLPNESNVAYKARLQDTFVHRANSTHKGLIYGITRELGLTIDPVVKFTIREVSTATNPGIRFRGPFMMIYSNCLFGSEVLETTIDRFDRFGNAYSLEELVEYVSEVSKIYTAELIDDTDPFQRSMTIIDETSCKSVLSESVGATNVIQLEETNIVEGSIFFSDTVVFATQKDSLAEVLASGDYYVDHTEGIVRVYSTPDTNTFVRYHFVEDPFIVEASPVIVHDILDEDGFKKKMFFQETLADLTTTHGSATGLGADLINELMSVYASTWGK